MLGGVIALFAVMPVRGADREHQQMMADIRMLQEQTVRLGLMLGTIDESLTMLLTKLDVQEQDTRRAFADQKLLVGNLSSGVRVVREKVDETNVRVSSLAQEVEALRTAIPTRTSPLVQLLVDPETGLPTAQPSVLVSAAVAPVNPGYLHSGYMTPPGRTTPTGSGCWQFKDLRSTSAAFPRSELADDAQFYIGNTYYADGQYREAADAFEQVVLNYPDGDAVAEALYKRGLALDRLGEPELARQAFELVVQNYSEDNMANLAQQWLNRLNQ